MRQNQLPNDIAFAVAMCILCGIGIVLLIVSVDDGLNRTPPSPLGFFLLFLTPISSYYICRRCYRPTLFLIYGGIVGCFYALTLERPRWHLSYMTLFNDLIYIGVLATIAVGVALASRFAAVLSMRNGTRQKIRDPICSSCGYNLTGNVSGICPECGWVIDPKTT